MKPNCLNIWHSRTCCINTFLTFWHTSAAVSYSTTKYILHTEAWRAFLSHYFKYAVPVNCLSNTGVYSSTEEQVNVCCLSRKKAKRRHKNGPAPGLFMAHWANLIHTGDFKKLTSLPHTTKIFLHPFEYCVVYNTHIVLTHAGDNSQS